MNIRVQGGTNAGRKKPPKPAPGPWSCRCVEHGVDEGDSLAVVWTVRPGYLVRCPDCGAERP